jgi:hypothetical protein
MIEEVHQYRHKKGKGFSETRRGNNQSAISLGILFPGLGLKAKGDLSLGFEIAVDNSKPFTMC